MKNRKSSALFLTAVAVCLILLSVSSCSRKHTADELRPVLAELLPKAAEINEIYFGAGLPTTRDENAVRAFYETFDTDIAAISYTPVDPKCGYASVDDIRAATLEVFTDSYAETLFDRAFTGISDTFDEGKPTEYRATALYAMYLEQDGFLTKRVDVGRDAIPLGRTYDLDSLTVLRENSAGVEVRLSSFVDGEPSVDVELWLVEGENGWRLDSPTY